MMLESFDGAGRARMALKVAAVALLAWVLSPASALGQRTHGGAGGSHWSGSAGGGRHFNGAGGHFGGFGHGHRGHLGGVVVIGGFGLWEPAFSAYPSYGYPYAYAPPVTYINTPPPAQLWYYCDALGAYYPYVASCPGGWRQVPAVPPAPGQ